MTHSDRSRTRINRDNHRLALLEQKRQEAQVRRERLLEQERAREDARRDLPRFLEALGKTFQQLAEDNPRSKRER